MKRVMFAAAMAAVLAAPVRWAGADVIEILSSGETREGVVYENPVDPSVITFRDHRGKIRLSRDKIRIVKRDQPGGLMSIADGYLTHGSYEQAIEYFEKAREAGAPEAEVQQGIDRARRLIAEEAKEERQSEVREIDRLLDQIEEQVAAKNFNQAKTRFDKIETLKPTAEQEARIKKTLIDFHFAWGYDRQDHLDYAGAAKHFERVLELAPKHEEARERLMECWRRDSSQDRRQVVAEYYEAKMKENPNDWESLRAAADIYFDLQQYDKALPLYIRLFDAEKGYEIQARLRQCFEVLHRQAAEKRDIQLAYDLYKAYHDRFPDIEDKPLLNYSYAIQREKILAETEDTTDTVRLDKLADLGFWCRANGLHDKAKKEFAYVLQVQPEHRMANLGRRQYARDIMLKARIALQQQDFGAAQRLASELIADYADQTALVAEAQTLLERVAIELERQLERQQEQARRLAEQGDEAYARAQLHINNYRSAEIDRDRTRINDYQLAKSALQDAINNWRKAKRLDPSLASELGLDAKIREATVLERSLLSQRYDYRRRYRRFQTGTGTFLRDTHTGSRTGTGTTGTASTPTPAP